MKHTRARKKGWKTNQRLRPTQRWRKRVWCVKEQMWIYEKLFHCDQIEAAISNVGEEDECTFHCIRKGRGFQQEHEHPLTKKQELLFNEMTLFYPVRSLIQAKIHFFRYIQLMMYVTHNKNHIHH